MACSAHGCPSKLYDGQQHGYCAQGKIHELDILNRKARDGCVDHEVITPLGAKAPFPY
jgi:hypothetical protein